MSDPARSQPSSRPSRFDDRLCDSRVAIASCFAAALVLGCAKDKPIVDYCCFPPGACSCDFENRDAAVDVAAKYGPAPRDANDAAAEASDGPACVGPKPPYLECVHGYAYSCCDDEAYGPSCIDGQWQCSPGMVDLSLCCAFGNGCQPIAAPHCPQPDAGPDTAPPPAPLCPQPLAELPPVPTQGFDKPPPKSATPAHVTGVTARAFSFALDAGGQMSLSWPSAKLPDLKVGDAVVLSWICIPDRVTSDSCWSVVQGPRAVAATYRAFGVRAEAPPPLHGFTFSLTACAYPLAPAAIDGCQLDPSFGPFGKLFSLDVGRAGQAAIRVGTAVEVDGWRFENLMAAEDGSILCGHYITEGGASVVLSATGPP